MANQGSSQPSKSNPPRKVLNPPRKPIQVVHISRKEEVEEKINPSLKDPKNSVVSPNAASKVERSNKFNENNSTELESRRSTSLNSKEPRKEEPLSMADLLDNESFKGNSNNELDQPTFSERTVDEYDFDEDEFLAALDQNQPVGTTGEIATGSVIGIESDGVYVDIGGKAPGFMPKHECGLGVITNFKERFPKGLKLEVLVTREQNADGMVTISCRALELRKSWEKVVELEKEGQVVRIKVNGFNRGGVTCDLEGLRGFIPRSQLGSRESHEALVGKTLAVAFIEVNPDTRKLILSEKKALIVAKFSELKLGQLVEGKVLSVKPYGFFVDIGGISGLLHQSMITNGSLRSLREVFEQGDQLKALITELDIRRGRIGLNTALLESTPGEIIVDKNKIMNEAEERAQKAQTLVNKVDESTSASE